MDEYKLAAYLGAIESKLDSIIYTLESILMNQVDETLFNDHHDKVTEMIQNIVDYCNDHY